MSALDIAGKLSDGIPVVAAMRIYESFHDAGETGLIEEPLAGEEYGGRHGVVCVEYFYAGPKDETLYLLIRNSWGVGLGLKGHAWISAETFAGMRDETATVIAA
jgi:hypothetical protein